MQDNFLHLETGIQETGSKQPRKTLWRFVSKRHLLQAESTEVLNEPACDAVPCKQLYSYALPAAQPTQALLCASMCNQGAKEDLESCVANKKPVQQWTHEVRLRNKQPEPDRHLVGQREGRHFYSGMVIPMPPARTSILLPSHKRCRACENRT